MYNLKNDTKRTNNLRELPWLHDGDTLKYNKGLLKSNSSLLLMSDGIF